MFSNQLADLYKRIVQYTQATALIYFNDRLLIRLSNASCLIAEILRLTVPVLCRKSKSEIHDHL